MPAYERGLCPFISLGQRSPTAKDIMNRALSCDVMEVVAYQGEVGAYSEEGATAVFPHAERRAYKSIRKVFEAVEVGRVAAGLVPLDNSQAGSINETDDPFLRHRPPLLGETGGGVDPCPLAPPRSPIHQPRGGVVHPP